MGAGGDHQRGVGVAQVVEAEAGQLRAADGGAEDAVAEVVVVQDRALGRGEDEVELVRLAREQLAAEDADGGGRQVDAPPRGARLHRHELSGVGAVLDDHGLRFEVEVAVAQGEQLALAQAGERGEHDHVPVRRGGVGGELLDLVPLLAVTETSGHGAVHAALDPARGRFVELDEEVQDAFRDLLARFVNLYAFVSQIVAYVDRRLERDYLYARALLACLPGQQAERLDLGSEVALTHLKLAQTYEGSASLEEGGGEVVAIFSGRGPQHDPESEHLSRIVDVMNERFGLELNDADQLLFDQFEESWAADESLAARARNNDFQNFRLVFDRTFLDTVVKRMDENDEIFRRILDDATTRQTVLDHYAERLYGRLRAEHDQLGLTEAP